MTPEESDHRRTLAAVAVELAAEVARLAEASKGQADALERLTVEVRNKTWKTTVKIRWMIALVVLCLILSGATLIGYFRTSDLIANQEVIKGQVLCPMYKIFLGSYQPETRTPGADRDKYEAAFKDMWTQYGALNCTGALVPPRYDLPHPPKPTALGPLDVGLVVVPPAPPPAVAPTAVVIRPRTSPTTRRIARRQSTPKATQSRKSSSGGGKSNSLLGPVTRAVPKAKVGADADLGPVKAKVRLHIP